MRHILTAAAAIAVSGLLVSTAAVAQYQQGGPTQASGQCKVSTDGGGNDSYGYMAPCAPSAATSGTDAYARAPATQSVPVIDGGQVLGADPDPHVRQQILRDGDMTGGAN